MTIAHFQGLWERSGGSAYLKRAIKGQLNRGYEVYYFDYEKSLPFVEEHGSPYENYITVENERELYDTLNEMDVDVLNTQQSFQSVVPMTVPTVRFVHDHSPHCPSFNRYLKRWEKPCPRSYSLAGCLWGHAVDHCGALRPDRWIEAFRKTQCDQETLEKMHSVTGSHFVKGEMLRSGYSEDRIHVIPIPAPEVDETDIPHPPSKDEDPHFLFLGRMIPEKGVDWLLRSLQHVSCPFHLDIAGEGRELSKMKELAGTLGVSSQVTFHGWVDEERRDQLFEQARTLIFPSIWYEPAGNVTLEAGAAGRAVIASEIGGIPEYAIDGENALMVEPENEHMMANRIEQLAQDHELAAELGQNGFRKVCNQFSLERHLDQLERIYQMAINEG